MTDNSTVASAPRRWRRAAGAVLATASLFLTVACSAGAPAQTQQGPVTIRVTFWGNDNRARITQQAVDAFEAANPDIKVALRERAVGRLLGQAGHAVGRQ